MEVSDYVTHLICERMHTWCICVYVHLYSTTMLKECYHKIMRDGGRSSSPTNRKLLNINSGSGHHTDYTTLTILHTASTDPSTPTYTHVLLCLSSHVHLDLKPILGEPCWRPIQTYINTFSHNRPQSRSLMRVLAWIQIHPLETHAPPHYTTQWKYKLIW